MDSVDSALSATINPHEPPWGGDLVRHYLGNLIYGANDGIITTFAVVTGVAGASLDPRIALILGFANLFADGFSMGASNFLSIRSEEAVLAAMGNDAQEPYPVRHAFATLLAFVLVGSVPLLTYLFASADHRLFLAVTITLATLFVVGALRATVTLLRWWVAGLEMLVVGAIAAAVSFGVGRMIAGFV